LEISCISILLYELGIPGYKVRWLRMEPKPAKIKLEVVEQKCSIRFNAERAMSHQRDA